MSDFHFFHSATIDERTSVNPCGCKIFFMSFFKLCMQMLFSFANDLRFLFFVIFKCKNIDFK